MAPDLCLYSPILIAVLYYEGVNCIEKVIVRVREKGSLSSSCVCLCVCPLFRRGHAGSYVIQLRYLEPRILVQEKREMRNKERRERERQWKEKFDSILPAFPPPTDFLLPLFASA